MSGVYWGPFFDFSFGEEGSVHRQCYLLPRPHYSARPMRFESRGRPSEFLKCIDREGLERRPSRQRLMLETKYKAELSSRPS